jgi:hypothetical protein
MAAGDLIESVGINPSEVRLMELAWTIDTTAAALRHEALAYNGEPYNNWEALRDAALDFAHVHDAYMLEQQEAGGEHLVGQFSIVYDGFHRQEHVARVGTNTFVLWCGYHRVELCPDRNQEYPIMTYDPQEKGWVIDLSEIDGCPGLPSLPFPDLDEKELEECIQSWTILEVPSRARFMRPINPVPSSDQPKPGYGDVSGVGALYRRTLVAPPPKS